MITSQPQAMAKIAIMHNNYGPYHLARLEAAALMGKERGVKVVGLQLASREAVRAWRIDQPRQVELITIFPERAVEDISSLELAKGTWSALQRLNPQAIALFLNKETYLAMLTVLAWKRLHRRMAILMTDSKYDDYPRHPLRQWAKKRVMSLYDGALVAGRAAREYAEFLGIAPERIFLGCDVVDNNYFTRGAEQARAQATSLRQQYCLPKDYFLYVGRFDEKKNVSGLLKAYSLYIRSTPPPPWDLVLCGSGPLQERVRQEARELGLWQVRFVGFQQVGELPIFYGLARCLIMHSLGDTWGLVVNEAMAAGLPVLVSRACGCAPDLVQEGVNGFTFDPYDLEGLAQLLGQVSSGEVSLPAMGEASRRVIADWGLETYSRNLLQLMAVCMAQS
jgi:1,2-diacylglycerol 3-alpha-glucosyltransferase